MRTGYKITDAEMLTYQSFQWTLNVWVESSGKGELCNDGWLHFYDDPILAVMVKPIHLGIPVNPRMFRCECEGEFKEDSGLKFGCTRARLVEELLFPKVSTTQRVAFATLVTKEVCQDKAWNKWADDWLSGKDRSAWAAAWAARAAARAARENTKPPDLIALTHKAVGEYK